MGLLLTALAILVGLASRSVGYGVAFFLAVAGIVLLIQHWRIQRRSMAPISELTAGPLYNDGAYWLLPITNKGTLVKRIWATISVTGETPNPVNRVLAVWWRHESAQRPMIGSGETLDLEIGEVKSDDHFLFWRCYVPFFRGGEQDSVHSVDGVEIDHVKPNQPQVIIPGSHITLRVEVEVFSEPADSNRLKRTVRIVGIEAREVDSGA